MGLDGGVAFTFYLCDLVSAAFVIFFKMVTFLFHLIVLLVPFGTLLAELFDLSVIFLVISLSSC